MKMYEVSEFITSNPNAVVQLMTTSSFLNHPFAYCCTAQELYDDWMDEASHCPENGDMILMCTLYIDNKAYPIESTGLDECNDFENLMRKIEDGLKNMECNMKYKVRYSSNTSDNDWIDEYETEEAAEKAIEEELENCKEYWQSLDYDYGDFGNKTEIWIPGGNEYASWERLWM